MWSYGVTGPLLSFGSGVVGIIQSLGENSPLTSDFVVLVLQVLHSFGLHLIGGGFCCDEVTFRL